jgi:hypothetical protein
MQRKFMTFAIFWFPIIGGILLGGFAGSAWYGGNKILALWLSFFGVVSFLLVVVIQLQQFISDEESNTPDADRPYISIVALGFPNNVIQPGPIVIRWQIKNVGRRPVTISDANMTFWLGAKEVRLPETPTYQPNAQSISGTILNPEEVYNANTASDFLLTQEIVDAINAEKTRLFVYGFVKYGKNYTRGFVGFYNPKNLPAYTYGMFTRVDGDYPEYSRND